MPRARNLAALSVVGVAQSEERRSVKPEVTSSNLVTHPRRDTGAE